MISDKRWEVTQEDSGTRLDSYLNEQLPDISRSKAKELISGKYVLVNNSYVKPSYNVMANDEIHIIAYEQASEQKLTPENIPLNIIYEDDDLIIVNKDRGMVVHPGAGNWEKTLVNALLYHCQHLSTGSSEERPGIVHRLDKDTSGLMVVAKNDLAHRKLSHDIKYKRIKRTYLALVKGDFPRNKATIDLPIGRNPKNRKQMAVVRSGKEAVTRARVLKRFSHPEHITYMKCQLETGRTHQIRVHFTSLGHPIIGDGVYGNTNTSLEQGLTGQLLHSFELRLHHPTKDEEKVFRAPLPYDMDNTIKQLGD